MLSVVWNLDLLVINRVLVWANHGGQFGQVVLGTSLSVATWSAPLLSFVGDYLTWTLVQFCSTLVQQVHFGSFHLVPPGSSNSYNITAPDATNNSTSAPPPLGVDGRTTEISPATDLFPPFVDFGTKLSEKVNHCGLRTLAYIT